MEITVKISAPVDVDPETFRLWVCGMLNVPNLDSNWTGFTEAQERELALLDEMDNDVDVEWPGNGSPSDDDVHSAACVAAVGLMDAEKRLRREVSQRLIARLGYEHQAAKVVEELAECIAAFVQFRAGRKSWMELAKEVADVLTVVDHIAHIIEPSLPLRINAEKFQAVVRAGVSGNWDGLSHMASDYEDLES